MLRKILVPLAMILLATGLTSQPATAQTKALVYCPVTIDATGCGAIVAALNAGATLFPGGVDGGYDGTEGTVDLATVDLAAYGVLVVPSLADGAGTAPYALLRNATIADRIKATFVGRVGVWSGTPDVGSTNRSAKDELIRNLAKWARPDSAGSHGPGLVALQDNSDDLAARYGWLGGLTSLTLVADTTFDVYSNVQVLTATGRSILTNSSGLQIGYTNMASYGLVRGAGTTATDEATGGRTSRVVLVTAAGEPSDPNIATVRTDREDYSPGDTVTVTGAGWEPGETVSLLYHEDVDPPVHPDKTLTTVADTAGRIFNQEYAIDETDVGVRFTLTATGQTSGKTAQTTFTDGNKLSFTTSAFSVDFNACSPVITVQLLQGSSPNNGSPTPVALSTSSGGGAFYSNSSCTTAVTSVTIPTSSSTVSFFYKDANTGTPTITAVAGTGCSGGNCTVTQAETVTGPDLTITKSHSGNFTAGSTGSYLITVTNSGSVVSSGMITVTDVLPTGFTYSSASGTNWSCPAPAGQTVTCTRGGGANAIAAGASAPAITLIVNVAANAPASITNTASVSGGGETNTGNDSASDPTTINGVPDLTIAKSHTGSFTQGSNGSYTLTVSNAGGAATSADVTVTDNLPTGLSFVSGTGIGWNACGAVGQVVTCIRPAANAIAAGGSSPAITLTVSVGAGAVPSVTNTASVSGGGEPAANAGNNSASDPTTVNGVPDLTIAKSHTGDFTENVNGVYTLLVSNGGNGATSGTVTVTDNLPTGLGFVSANGTGWTCGFATGTVTCTRTTAIAPAGSAPAITLTVSVGAAAVPGVTNTASVSGGGEPAGNSGNNGASDPTTVIVANHPPVAVNDGPYTVNEDNTLTVTAAQGVLANDTDADGDSPLTAVLVTGPAAAATSSFTLNSDGSFSFKPADDFNGSVSFTYRANDGKVNSVAAATVSITVNSVNDAPSFTKGPDQTVNEGAGAQTVTAWATAISAGPANEAGQTLTFTVTNDNNALFSAQPSVAANGTLTYTPATGTNGSATVTVTLKDNGGTANGGVDTSAPQTFTITVNAVNDAPSFTKGANQTVDEDAGAQTVTGWATNISVGPADESGQTLTFQVTNTNNALFLAQPAVAPNGTLTYTPADNANGSATVTVVLKDNGGTANGGVDTSAPQTFTITVNPVNDAPVLAAIGNKTVNEETLLSFTTTATDIDLPAQTLTFSLDAGAPTGAAITSAGAFTWTPTEAQGPGDYPVTIRVADGALDDFETISIHVDEVNVAPVLTGVPATATVNELTVYSFDADATDADDPAQTLTFSLVGAPPGATINGSTGAFSWTPTEAQGPGSYPFTVQVSDGVAHTDASITITVNEVNQAPVLASIGDQTVDEEVLLSFTATASDPDLPANTLSFSLTGTVPAGATITAGGAFSWSPTEAQGPGDYTFTVQVTDDGSPALSDEEEITVHVNEVNVAPELASIGAKTVDEETALSFTAAATDHDEPANTLTFSLDAGSPAGASITPAGAFTWTPTEAQGPGDYPVTVRVTDNGVPALSDFETITIHVNEVNLPPVLASIGNQSVDEEQPLSFTAHATDPDLPANTLSFSLVGEPTGATINPTTGAFSWSPTEAQGPGNYTFKVKVTDNSTPALSDDEEITVHVNEVNQAPVLAAIASQAGPWDAAVAFAASATDPDLPANTLTFSLRPGAPAGATINPATGAFGWTPAIGDVGTQSITVRVTDNGTPALYAEQTFSVTVQKHATLVIYTGSASGIYGSGVGVSASLTDATTGTPLAGKTINFTIGGLAANAPTISAGGAATASTSVTLAQNAGSYSVVSSFAEDAGYLGSSDLDPFAINPAPLTAKADDKKMYFGAAGPPPFTVTYTGFVLGQNSSVLSGSPVFGGAAVGANASTPVGSYTITVGGVSSSNYTITPASGTLKVVYNELAGHAFLQPVNPNLTTGNRSTFKIGSTIPVKFQIFLANGTTPVSTVIATVSYVKVDNTVESSINEEVVTVTPDAGNTFRYDPTGQQYIFNLSTKNWTAGTWQIKATLDDGNTITALVDGRAK